MSSFARAERRRQERAAARQPAEVDGLRLVFQRGPADCLRAAVATATGLDYQDTPEYDGAEEQFAAWRLWLAARGWAMHHYFTHSPACDVWIASVLMPFPHAVVVKAGALYHDPDPVAVRVPLIAPVASSAVVVGPQEWVQETGERTRALIAQGSPEVWPLPAPLSPELRRLHPPAPVPPFLIEVPI